MTYFLRESHVYHLIRITYKIFQESIIFLTDINELNVTLFKISNQCSLILYLINLYELLIIIWFIIFRVN